MQSLAYIPGSNGAANASMATVQTLRAAGATDNLVNTVSGWPTKFYAVMGTPHTFTDPVTGETITIVSDASAVEFAGHISTGKIVIDAIAPGYTDQGSKVGDIIVVKPTTEWANNLFNTLSNSLNDDGSLKNTAIITALGGTSYSQGWNAITGTITSVTYNGNRSYTLGTSADNTSTINKGMRLRTTNTVAAPTQSASLNGTNQYFNNTSPNKLTGTNNYTIVASIKLTSYPAAGGSIVSRWNGTSGWDCGVTSTGQLYFSGYNGAAANRRSTLTYQSVPLNKWTDIMITLDMSGFTTTTCKAMFDCVDVPVQLTQAGTNPTAWVNAGNLEVGSTNGGTQPFPGKIAQVGVFSALIAESTIRGYASQSLVGTETSLASAWSLSNSLLDLNITTPNNLTPQNSAGTTAADAPWGGQADGSISATLNYAIVQAITSSTMTVQVPEGCKIPTSGGISAAHYSIATVPYGFPRQRGKWTINSQHRIQVTQTSAAANTWYNVASQQLNIPIGEWIAGYSTSPIASATTSTILYQTLSPANNTAGDTEFVTQAYLGATATHGAPRYVRRPLSISAATSYYLNSAVIVGTSVTIYNLDNTLVAPPSMIEIENAYL